MTTVSRKQVYVCPRVVHRAIVVLAAALLALGSATGAAAQGRRARLSEDLAFRLSRGDAAAERVIVTGTKAEIDRLVERHGLTVRKRLATGAVVEVPGGGLEALAADTDQVSSDFRVRSQMALTTETTGASQVWEDGWAPGMRGLTGRGVGVAVIDSGVDPLPELRGRIVASVDFTDDRGPGHDEYGHGTHVAGIIAAGGRGRDDGSRGMAPGAHIVSLKVLGADGSGRAGDVVEAIDWAIAHRRRFNIKVINLSLGAPVMQSWRDDPVCQAVERAFRAGITVVASAGNRGRTAAGQLVLGSVSTPGNSPFAFTVGALNGKGTAWRSDDELTTYSAKGPTRFDRLIKPDIVAPGNRITSLLARNAKLPTEHPELVTSIDGTRRLQLSGTSMAAAAVSGATALILEHKALGPAATRTILQASATSSPGSPLIALGAGSLNVLGALVTIQTGSPSSPTTIAGEVQTPGATVFWHSQDLGAFEQHAFGESSDIIYWGDTDIIYWGDSDIIYWGDSDIIYWGDSDIIYWGDSDIIYWGD